MTELKNVKPENGPNDANEPADFEKAITESGFGLFNFILVAAALPSCFATVYETSTMSYILPSAECDLKLSLFDKGVLNAITYAGMISSAIFWGYAADTFGRKKLLAQGFLSNVICVTGCVLAQNIYVLMFFKYFGGFIICGPFAVLMSYVTEFHGVKYRSRIMMAMGMFFTIATFFLPLIAWAILPQFWRYEFFGGYLVINNWRIFLAVCGLPNLLGGLAMLYLPESPKFLMSQGRNSEALEVFKWVYACNTRKSADEYPIKELTQEVPQKIVFDKSSTNDDIKLKISTLADSLMDGLRQLKPMFQKPYLGHTIHVYTIQFFILMGQNTVRLWLPQLFTSIANYIEANDNSTNPDENSNLCSMLEYNVNLTNQHISETELTTCEVKISDEMYVNTMTVALSGIGGYLVAGGLINAMGQKWILVFGLLISGSSGIILYWAKDSLATLILTATYVTVGSISSTALLGVTVSLFPTSLRTMIVSLAMMFGRLGALIGNLLFPIFMTLGCIPPFLLVGSVMWVGSFLCLMLPQTHKNALK
ncbi:synaptic vesicle glycoprotein 2B-like [Condylostylus longicornis]|uniref:synaptic vesicle glycoprotein 2B-like n=1 Tax=Condylostylus longicornis TaxID=2530218 RepID=UPI00244E138B|nr:synaptic vesicle glycoprotein 2B-like [Condylostylus longicornis]